MLYNEENSREIVTMDIAAMKQKIEAVQENDKIACREALKLAAELGVSPDEVGKTLNEMKIKIVHCQLGCFP
jgi:hypothetical protein